MKLLHDELFDMMSGYDISDEEMDRIAAVGRMEEARRDAEQEGQRLWELAYEKQQAAEALNDWYIQMYGRILPDFYEGMPYKEYLQTHRWRATAELVKERDDRRCQVCRSCNKLNVHHRTYEHIFHEIFHMEDLVTLCEYCHGRHHLGIINIEKILKAEPTRSPQ